MNDNGAGLMLGVVVFVAAFGVVALAATAWIVHMGAPAAGTGEAIVSLVQGAGPAEAWQINGSDGVYWAVFAAVLLTAIVLIGLLVRAVAHKRWGDEASHTAGFRNRGKTRQLQGSRSVVDRLETGWQVPPRPYSRMVRHQRRLEAARLRMAS